MFLDEEFRGSGEPQREPIQFSKGYPSKQDPAADGRAKGKLDNIGAGDERRLRNHYGRSHSGPRP